jgi:hypothetical protein
MNPRTTISMRSMSSFFATMTLGSGTAITCVGMMSPMRSNHHALNWLNT